METKTCCMCKQSLPITSFKSHPKRGLQSHCIECQKEYRRQHYIRNRQKYIDKAKVKSCELRLWWKEYKSQFVCSKCGESHPACIDFHHFNDDKEYNIAHLVSHGKAAVLKELKKCVPLCRNCHAKEHWNE